MAPRTQIPRATVNRLPEYLRSLVDLADSAVRTVSSERLAELAGVNAAKVRKDLSYLGSYGTRGVGYDVDYLIEQVRRLLGVTREWPVVIVGMGNLGHALAKYRGFGPRGFRVAALVDVMPSVVGTNVAGLPVHHLDDLAGLVEAHDISLGIVATNAPAAQDVADRMVKAGIRSILNFAPIVLNVPPGVTVRKVDLALELQILTFYGQRAQGAPDAPVPA